MATKTYDDKFKTSVLLMLEAAGYPQLPVMLERVAEHVKVSPHQIGQWFEASQQSTDDNGWLAELDTPDEPEPNFDHIDLEQSLAELQTHVIEGTLKRPFMLEKQAAYRFRAGKRRENVLDLIPELPDPGVDLYILANGIGGRKMDSAHPDSWGAVETGAAGVDFGAFIPHFIELVSPDGPADLCIATWSVDNPTATVLVDLLDAGRIRNMTLCVGRNFHQVRPGCAYFLLQAFQRHKQRYVAFRTHAKVICVSNPRTAVKATVTGSANFSSQPRIEQFVVTTSPDVHDFFVTHLFEWALAQLEQHGID